VKHVRPLPTRHWSWAIGFVLCGIVVAWPTPARAYSHPGSTYTQQQYVESVVLAWLGREPWRSAYLDMVNSTFECFSHESELAKVHNTFLNGKRLFEVPKFYDDTDESEAMSKPLVDDARVALLCAMRSYFFGDSQARQIALDLLASWAETTLRLSGTDTGITMVHTGVGLLLAADLLRNGGDGTWFGPFKTWAQREFHRAASDEYSRFSNNHRSWALFAELVYAHLLDDEVLFRTRANQLYSHIDASIDQDGFLPAEVERQHEGFGKGIFYTQFSLAPMTAGVQIIQNVLGTAATPLPTQARHDLRRAIQSFIYYNAHPNEWPARTPNEGRHVPYLYDALSGLLPSQELSIYAVPHRPAVSDRYAWKFATLMRPHYAATLPPIVHTQTFDNGINAFTPINGTWNVTSADGGVYRQSSPAANTRALVGYTDWLDYTFETWIKIQSFADTLAGAGIIFRYVDENNHYTFHYYASTRQLRLERKVNGVYKVLQAYTVPGGLQLGVWYRFRVQVNGPHIDAYLNNTRYLFARDHSMLGGAAGLWAHRADVLFDDAVMWDPIGLDLEFSNEGPVAGKSCTSLDEPSDPEGTWSDNYICANQDLGWVFSSAGEPEGLRCTKIVEDSEPEETTWQDNFLCLPAESSFEFHWSSSNQTNGLTCENFDEPSDPHTWSDNILCY